MTSNITSISEGAFENCTSLTEIELPSTITKISDGMFKRCHQLQKLIIPILTNHIGKSAFEDCSSLTEFEIPSSMKIINEKMFKGCTSLSKIIIPTNIENIESNAFEYCSSLTEIELPSTITMINDRTFKGCHQLQKLIIPISIKDIGEGAFEDCSSLIEIELPSSITEIKTETFKGCTSLQKIILPISIRDIGDKAFKNFSSLTEFEIPSIINIRNGLFKGCSSLHKIIIAPSIRIIGRKAFKGCSSLTEIKIPSSITNIKDNAFENCTLLTKINIPSSVIDIGKHCFENCTSLFDFTIPDSITIIKESTFKKCSSLKTIKIPSSVKMIEDFSFNQCQLLKKDLIPESVKYISRLAFDDYSNEDNKHFDNPNCTLCAIKQETPLMILERNDYISLKKLPSSKEKLDKRFIRSTNLTGVYDQARSRTCYAYAACSAYINTILRIYGSSPPPSFQECYEVANYEVKEGDNPTLESLRHLENKFRRGVLFEKTSSISIRDAMVISPILDFWTSKKGWGYVKNGDLTVRPEGKIDPIGHAVLVEGYDFQKKCYICKNSWNCKNYRFNFVEQAAHHFHYIRVYFTLNSINGKINKRFIPRMKKIPSKKINGKAVDCYLVDKLTAAYSSDLVCELYSNPEGDLTYIGYDIHQWIDANINPEESNCNIY